MLITFLDNCLQLSNTLLYLHFKRNTMTQEIKSGTKLYSPRLDCTHTLVTVTDKKVSYKPDFETGGLVVNKNRIRIFTTSRRKAELWIKEGTWIVQ